MELEHTPDIDQMRRLLFPDLPPEEGWKQIELAFQGALDEQRWRRIEQRAATNDDAADLALDLVALIGAHQQPAPLDPEQQERSDRFRLTWLRADTLISAGYTPGQAAQLASDPTIGIPDALALLDAGMPAADATVQLLDRHEQRPHHHDR